MIVAGVAGVAVIAGVVWFVKRRTAAADPLDPSVLHYDFPALSRSSSPDSVIGAWQNTLRAVGL